MTTKKIKQIDIVFENCEVAQIFYDQIYSMYTKFNARTVHIPWGWNGGNYSDTLEATYVYLYIFDLDKVSYISMSDEPKELLKRLNYPDITHIDIIYVDGTNEYISVPWKDKSRYSSIYQTVRKINTTYNDKPVWEIAITRKGILRRNLRLFKEAIVHPIWFIKRKLYNFKDNLHVRILYVKICNFIYYLKHPDSK